MLATSNVTMQFGAKPLIENVTVKFVDGNRYGLIGANGCGKSTFMKILGRELEQSSGEVMLQNGLRLGRLRQDGRGRQADGGGSGERGQRVATGQFHGVTSG